MEVYLENIANPEILDNAEHILSLNLLKHNFELIKTELISHRGIIDMKAHGISRSQLSALIEASWTRGNCEKFFHEIGAILAHPKWSYIVHSNLERGIDIQASILFAEVLGLDIFTHLMKLAEQFPDSPLVWQKLSKYQDPWMLSSFFDLLELKLNTEAEKLKPITKQLEEVLGEFTQAKAKRLKLLLAFVKSNY